jgi:hypothetical protein
VGRSKGRGSGGESGEWHLGRCTAAPRTALNCHTPLRSWKSRSSLLRSCQGQSESEWWMHRHETPTNRRGDKLRSNPLHERKQRNAVMALFAASVSCDIDRDRLFHFSRSNQLLPPLPTIPLSPGHAASSPLPHCCQRNKNPLLPRYQGRISARGPKSSARNTSPRPRARWGSGYLILRPKISKR